MKTTPPEAYQGLVTGKAPEKINYVYHFQEKRREYLDQSQKQRREELLLKSRRILQETKQSYSPNNENNFEEIKDEEDSGNFVEERGNNEQALYEELAKMELERDEEQNQKRIQEEQQNGKKKSPRDYEKRPLKYLAKEMTVPEWMINPPSNLNKDYWFVYCKPDGKRCFIISSNYKTICRNKNGFYESTFLTKLPGGSPSSEKGKTCILDCIFNEQLNVYFIMDVIIWRDISMNVNSTESRFFFIENNILADKELQEISEENQVIFVTPKRYDCTIESFLSLYRENTPYCKDGILFAHKEAAYIGGSNPYLLLWKDVFTSLYAIETDGGRVTSDVHCVLKVDDNYQLQTLDEITLTVLEENDTDPVLCPGDLVKVSIESISFNEKADNLADNIIFHGVRVLKKSSYKRASADNVSKIIFQYLLRNSPIKADQIVEAMRLNMAQEIEEEEN